jgi:hypothetical protein
MEVCTTEEPVDSHIDGLTVRCHLVGVRGKLLDRKHFVVNGFYP